MSKITGHDVAEFIREKVKETGRLTIVGFGSFNVVDKPARTARNPRTGEAVQVPAKTTVTFKPSKTVLG